MADSSDYLRAMQARILRHSFDHLPGTIDARSAVIISKNELITSPLINPLTEDEIACIEHLSDARLRSLSVGPFVVFREANRKRDIVEIKQLLLNLDKRLRHSGLSHLEELVRNYPFGPFVSPQLRNRLAELRSDILSDAEESSIDACIEPSDWLDDDFFYSLAGLRQAIKLRTVDEFGEWLQPILKPKNLSLAFLVDLPVWSPSRQRTEIVQLRESLLGNSTTRVRLLNEYFRYFGHLPLAGEFSASHVFAEWKQKHDTSADAWEEIWKWADENGSPLARYHACEIFCAMPELVSKENEPALLKEIRLVVDGSQNHSWKLRCDLARHYCQHLECMEPGADGERVASCAWWLAEYVACVFDELGTDDRAKCDEIVAKAVLESVETWSIGFPITTASPLRYMTVFPNRMWGAALLSRFGKTRLLTAIHDDKETAAVVARALGDPAYLPTGVQAAEVVFLFESEGYSFAESLLNAEIDTQLADKIRSLQRLVASIRVVGGLESSIRDIFGDNLARASVIAHEMRLRAFCGPFCHKQLFDALSDPKWREELSLLDIRSLELVCTAAIASALEDEENEWRNYLPHLLALACAECTDKQRRAILFDHTVVASLAFNISSAVERLLTGENRRDYQELVNNWRQRIDHARPVVAPWIAAKLRGMKCIMHVD